MTTRFGGIAMGPISSASCWLKPDPITGAFQQFAERELWSVSFRISTYRAGRWWERRCEVGGGIFRFTPNSGHIAAPD
jgi:hypothetical protein